ncbi:tRNA dimethylallyltransferase isoform X2 [Lingula anatina]|uniref:tRNA dimethylallyltransferase isoform X2 n=1 Tax=Lingula anatina TaxID=7574 RepID=A0A1S3JKI0_LINAN|nr:tRNA dimethylallyltransferase isoform X2 [Lingula anatina]|eukprot:XP_013410631.1 tRNA dimethylallyltransferase isoform X2 [Lingula anatina]
MRSAGERDDVSLKLVCFYRLGYYVRQVIVDLRVKKCVSSDEEGEEAAVVTPSDELLELRENFDDLDSRELYAKLMSVDPSYAKTLHPNNKRKIIRGLEVHSQHGVTMSEILAEQHQEDQDVSGPLRYQHNCIFWVQCQQTVLDERLDKRVDSMLERGLVAELLDFHSRYNQQRLEEHKEADYTHGIFQSIGFKEFHNYLILPEQERQSQMGETLLKEGIDALKLVTRRYARRQITWIKNRLLRRPGQDVPAVYTVDATKPEEWDYAVLEPACHILETIMKGDVPLISPAQKEVKQSDPVVHKICDICDGQILLTQSNWEGHLKSRKHLKRVYKKRKRQRELLQLMQSYEKKKHTEAAGGPIGAVADDSAST